MDEEYDVIVLGTGLTVSLQALIPPQTDKRTHDRTATLLFCASAQAFNPRSMRRGVKSLPHPRMSLYGCNNHKKTRDISG